MKISGPPLATLTGLAVGDALGMPFETKHRGDPAFKSWRGNFLASEYHGLKPGQWTDDTVMAKALAESLLQWKTYSPADAARRYREWYQEGITERRGMGKTTEKALARLAHGLPWTQSGDPDSLGNGSAMRAAPLGVCFRDNIQAAAEMARVDSQITHRHQEAVAGSVAMATGVAAMLQGRATKDNLISKVLGFVPEKTQLWHKLHAAKAVAVRRFPGEPKPHTYPVVELCVEMGTSAQVFETVASAFIAFVATDNFEQAIMTAIRAGGDTDTRAAMAGALAGTFYGFKQVAPFIDRVEANTELRALEQNLFNAAPPMYNL